MAMKMIDNTDHTPFFSPKLETIPRIDRDKLFFTKIKDYLIYLRSKDDPVEIFNEALRLKNVVNNNCSKGKFWIDEADFFSIFDAETRIKLKSSFNCEPSSNFEGAIIYKDDRCESIEITLNYRNFDGTTNNSCLMLSRMFKRDEKGNLKPSISVEKRTGLFEKKTSNS